MVLNFRSDRVATTWMSFKRIRSMPCWRTRAIINHLGSGIPAKTGTARGGGDTDLGDPIYAISHGRVAEFGDYPPSWGNIVLLEHALPDGTRVWSQYAHLDQIMVSHVGQQVRRGQQIGTMGKGARTAQYPQGRWIAHLHFEIRRTKLPIGNWTPMVRDQAAVQANYFSPTPFINARRPWQFAQTAEATSRIQVVVDSQRTDPKAGRFRRAKVDYWYSAPVGFQGTMLVDLFLGRGGNQLGGVAA